MRPYTFDIDPANASAAGIASANSSAGATVTLDGALTSGGSFTSADGLAHRISIIDLGAHVQTGATYTITGTDSDGITQTEDIAGPGASATIETTKYWLTITSIAIASPVAGSTVNIGTVDEVMSKTLPLNYRAHEPATYATTVTGTINYTVQETMGEVHLNTPSTLTWYALTALAAKTANLKEPGELHTSACRIITTTYTDTAEIQIIVFQNEY